MTALVITAAQVLPDDTGSQENGTSGATITPGQSCYLDTATNTYKLFDANLTSANTAEPVVSLNTASAGQPLKVQKSGTMTLGAGASPVAGTIYVAGATAGDIAPAADVASGWRVTIIGVGVTGNKLLLIPKNTGVTL